MNEDAIENLLEHRDVPPADRLLLALLSAGAAFEGQSEVFDVIALAAFRHLERQYPEVFDMAATRLAVAISNAENGPH